MLLRLIAAAAVIAQTITGRVTTEPPPASIEIRFGESSVTCPIARDGKWECSLPRGTHDLRLVANGYAPVYIWHADLTNGHLDLGDLALVAGASVSGWVSAEREGFDLRRAKLRLVPEGDPDPGPRSYTTQTSDRGFFQFTNVFPGTYAVVAEADGLSPARSIGIVVRESGEYVIDQALTLRELARLEVIVTPPVAPDGKPWTVVLRRHIPMSSLSTQIQKEAVPAHGRWTSAPLQSGRHVVRIEDAAGTVHDRREISVEPGMAPVFITTSSVLVKGRVVAGGDPLAASLKFFTGEGQHHRVETDEQGRFESVFPAVGKWRVDVMPKGTRQTLNPKPVTIRRLDGWEHASVEVKLSGARIRGKVVDERNEPLACGVVVTRNGVPDTDTRSADDGTFALIGIEPGVIRIEAMSDKGESGPIELAVDEKSELQPVTLVVAKTRTIDVTLTTRTGYPVAGAQVRYAGPAITIPREAVSSPSGRFQLLVPANATAASLAIVAPGLPSKLTTVLLPERERRIGIVIEESGGRLQMRGNGAPPWPYVLHDGAAWAMFFLLTPPSGVGPPSWVQPGGVTLEVEPGRYSLCPDPQPSDRCITQMVVAGATTVFDTTPWSPAKEVAEK